MRLLLTIAAAALMTVHLPAAAHEGKKKTHKAAQAVKEQKAWGISGDLDAATRTIELVMSDNMRFTPRWIDVREGEIIRFVVKNDGRMLHELVLGTKQELDAHAAMMLKFPGMEHDEAHMVHVGARKSGALVWNFNRPGTFQFACLIPGHHQAGMAGTILVRQADLQGEN